MANMEDGFQGLSKSLSQMSKAIATPIPMTFPKIPDNAINPAKWMYERLVKYIKEFEESLDSDHEVAARLVSFGQTITIHIDDLGYHGPDIITFDGQTKDGEVVQLIQHTSQLSVLLIAVKKQQKVPRRIGFRLDQAIQAEGAQQ